MLKTQDITFANDSDVSTDVGDLGAEWKFRFLYDKVNKYSCAEEKGEVEAVLSLFMTTTTDRMLKFL